MKNKKTLKQILNENKTLRILHNILIAIFGLEIVMRIFSAIDVINKDSSLLFIFLIIVIIFIFSGAAFLGLIFKKKWAYWVIILLVFNTFSSSAGNLIGIILTVMVYMPIPIYLLYKVSQEKKPFKAIEDTKSQKTK